MKCLFGKVENESVILNKLGNKAREFWGEIPSHFENILIDEYVIMPNHIHGIIFIFKDNPVGVQYIEPLHETHNYQKTIPKSLSTIVRTYKAALTRWCSKNGYLNFKWQRNFFERVIRTEEELNRIREYVYCNPVKWSFEKDKKYSENIKI